MLPSYQACCLTLNLKNREYITKKKQNKKQRCYCSEKEDKTEFWYLAWLKVKGILNDHFDSEKEGHKWLKPERPLKPKHVLDMLHQSCL